MKLYLIRHGETEGNHDHRTQGWTDVRLTEKGINQACALSKALSDKKFDRIIASDILRTRQTAALIFGENAPIEYDSRLREINNTVFAGKLSDELVAEFGPSYKEYAHRLDYEKFGGESAKSLLERTADFLHDIESDSDSKKIAVVTHGGTIRAFISNITGARLQTTSIVIHNCSVTVIELKNGEWRLLHINNNTEF